MSVPMKFREIGDFHEYYSGTRKAPYLTIFVGGNHEASNHLFELYYGGWVAPNIYYMGAANVIRLGPLRIAGLSGIWKGYNYNKPHHERLPYSQDDVKSIYHVRELDVRKLLQLKTQVDVGISHDWPRGVEWLGNWKALFAKKDLFEADARAGTLGSSAAKYVMDRLRPPHWFSAHLHCKFSAIVEYGSQEQAAAAAGEIQGRFEPVPSNGVRNANEIDLDLEDASAQPMFSKPTAPPHNEDEIDIDMDEDEPAPASTEIVQHGANPTSTPTLPQIQVVPVGLRAQLPASFSRPPPSAPPAKLPPPPAITNQTTRFLALDKCLPNRKFLQILTINPISQPDQSAPATPPYRLSYDKEWLAITRVFASHLILGDPAGRPSPDKGEAHYRPLIEAEAEWVEQNIVAKGKMTIPENFEFTAPVYDPSIGIGTREQPVEYTNPQTVRFCEMLGVGNPFAISEEEREVRRRDGPRADEGRMDGRRGGRGGGGGGYRGRGRGGGGGGRGRGRGGGGGRSGGRGFR